MQAEYTKTAVLTLLNRLRSVNASDFNIRAKQFFYIQSTRVVLLQPCTANLVPGSYSVSYRHLRGTGLKRLLLKFNFSYLRGVLGDFPATEHETNEEGQSCVVGISISEHTCHGLTLMK